MEQHARETAVGIDFGECGLHGGDIAAMPVDEIEAAKAVAGERADTIAQDRDQGRGPEAHRAGETQMVLGHAHRNGGSDEGVDPVAHRLRQVLGANRIGADQAIGPVLFGRSDGHDDAVAVRQIALHIGPGLQMQKHGMISSITLLPRCSRCGKAGGRRKDERP